MANETPKGEITLAEDWKLVPVDARNWELCRKKGVEDKPASRERGTVGTVKWVRCGRYYSYNTVAEALRYVADELMKEKAREQAMTLATAIRYYEVITQNLISQAQDRLKGPRTSGLA